MAKTKKAASKTTPPKASKKVSVKKIVAEINKSLAKLESAKATITQAQAKGAGPDPRGYALDRAIMSLRGARDVAQGTCVPGFDIPY
jgi:hypothetical protein